MSRSRRNSPCWSRIRNSPHFWAFLTCCERRTTSLGWFPMNAALLTLLHLAVAAAKRCRPGGVRAVIAENLQLKQQLIVLRRPRQRAPNLTGGDRIVCGLGSLFLSPNRIRKVAIGVRPATLLAFHRALVRRKYRRLFSSKDCPRKPGSAARGLHGLLQFGAGPRRVGRLHAVRLRERTSGGSCRSRQSALGSSTAAG